MVQPSVSDGPVMDLAAAIRQEADVSSRTGQFDRLNALADLVEEMEGRLLVADKVFALIARKPEGAVLIAKVAKETLEELAQAARTEET